MRVLITTGKFNNYLVPNFYNLLMLVKKHTNIKVWHESGDITDIIGRSGFKPDLVFINEFGESNSPRITGLEHLTIPYVLLLYDLHYQVELRNSELEKLNPRLIFTLYRQQFYRFYPRFAEKMYWFPHHVDTNLFKDYGLPKEIDFLLIGDVHERVYPLRHLILNSMRQQPGFVYHSHPGWRVFSEAEKSRLMVGENYAREINRAKLFLTCDSIYHYPLLKYFEVPACNTLLLAPASDDLLDLGFIPGEHFVAIDEHDFKEKADYYLKHETERQKIARQGYEMVRKRHSTEKRAQDFINIINRLLSQ